MQHQNGRLSFRDFYPAEQGLNHAFLACRMDDVFAGLVSATSGRTVAENGAGHFDAKFD
jgi:hypothetical protein